MMTIPSSNTKYEPGVTIASDELRIEGMVKNFTAGDQFVINGEEFRTFSVISTVQYRTAADEEPIVSKLRARSTGRAEEEYEFFSTEHGIFVGGRGPEDGEFVEKLEITERSVISEGDVFRGEDEHYFVEMIEPRGDSIPTVHMYRFCVDDEERGDGAMFAKLAGFKENIRSGEIQRVGSVTKDPRLSGEESFAMPGTDGIAVLSEDNQERISWAEFMDRLESAD